MPPRFFFWRGGGFSPLKGENRMENMDLIEHIQQKFPKMSKGQKAIATFIMENYDKAAFMTAGALGRTVGVSESTVVRFACVLGYEGYPKLQKHLQEIIKNKLTNVQKLNLLEGLSTEELVRTVYKMETKNLKHTVDMLDVEVVNKVVDALVHAKKIFVIGFRSCAPLVQFIVY